MDIMRYHLVEITRQRQTDMLREAALVRLIAQDSRGKLLWAKRMWPYWKLGGLIVRWLAGRTRTRPSRANMADAL